MVEIAVFLEGLPKICYTEVKITESAQENETCKFI